MSRSRELFSDPEMAAIFSDDAHLQAMLDFEAALARAEARAGVIPAAAAASIADACQAELYDAAAIYEAARLTGAHSIPLVAALTARAGDDAGRFVHWGATSQDAIDTAFMLQARDGLDWLQERLLSIGSRCADLAQQHRDTPLAGRTLLQHALPLSFGLKAARWLSMVARQVEQVRRVRDSCLAVQFGGAVGTLSALGDTGPLVMDLLGTELGLSVPDLPWHTERDRVAGIASTLSVVAGAMSKVAGDLVLLAQTELSEVAEGVAEGKGGSSAMPHKRNPVDVTFALAAARLAQAAAASIVEAMAHEHERAVGRWQAEWVALPDAFAYTAGAVARVDNALSGLSVDAGRMRANLDLTSGLLSTESLTIALAAHIGRPEAFRLVRVASDRARTEGLHLRAVALADERIVGILSAAEIDAALDPVTQLGSSQPFIDRALARFASVRDRE